VRDLPGAILDSVEEHVRHLGELLPLDDRQYLRHLGLLGDPVATGVGRSDAEQF
jgi:hypothetical protein